MEKQTHTNVWFIILLITIIGVISWNYEAIDAIGSPTSVEEFTQADESSLISSDAPLSSQPVHFPESEMPSTTQSAFDPQTTCTQAGWKWKDYGALTWCETYHPCGEPIPTCPGGNDNWQKITESSRMCDSTKSHGYRVYCNLESDNWPNYN